MCMRAPSLWRAMLPSTSVLQLLFVSVFRRSFFATPSSHLPVLCKCCFCLLFRRPCHRHAKLTSASVAQVLLPSFARRPYPRRDMIPSTYVVQALFLYFFVAPSSACQAPVCQACASVVSISLSSPLPSERLAPVYQCCASVASVVFPRPYPRHAKVPSPSAT